MIVHDTRVAGVKLVEPKVFGDQRGFFLETFNRARYCELLNINFDFVQDNHSRSSQGVLRGLHFQTARPQGKLVRCVRGEVYDVVVDIRPESSTFKQWVGVYLSEDNKNQLWVPPGLAHGFVVISESADFEYKCTDYYDPQNEGCLIWNDADIGVEWPVENPLLSAKDKLGKRFSELF
ncbi:dTDP-4-dehydrorhamnose 3,5-epimerase [Serratia proteamaculans]|uniref:dTDP-4-dehydrorhamnose 3,5-epimerase n=1 Tax=Serratia proteamaculans TaxID=28151 RepID=A0ABS0U258_SERPR|nr:dTDP-4-dehydrorhamnose 3,5-epimerase [Serratia proteamaculans]MBI6183590.1 dTDP-4-dehydrorhamnose 3,5-epimerase [Serratia proteamaculans]